VPTSEPFGQGRPTDPASSADNDVAGEAAPDVPFCAAPTTARFAVLARRSERGEVREIADSGSVADCAGVSTADRSGDALVVLLPVLPFVYDAA